MKEITLFTLPFAGGNKFSYRPLTKYLPSFLKVINLEYPGRGLRSSLPLVTDINILVDDLYNEIKQYLDNREYAIFGHSIGGLITYLLARKIIENNHQPPEYLFITGTPGPEAPSRITSEKHNLNKEDFLTEVRNYEGSPKEIFEDYELLDYFEPILRADFMVSETYKYQYKQPLDIPIIVITGKQEEMDISEVRLWNNVTIKKVEYLSLPGKHFFIFDYAKEIIEIISKKLYNRLNKINNGRFS